MKNITIITICLITFGINLFAQDETPVATENNPMDKGEIVGEVS